MVRRCTEIGNIDYHNYGGRGIAVYAEWLDFSNFLADMGPRPGGKTLDRIDPNGSYEPGNCRWAAADMQARNKRNIKLDEIGASQIRWLCTDGAFTKAEVAKAFGVSRSSVTDIATGRTWRVPS